MREARIRPGDRKRRLDLRRLPPSLRESAEIFEPIWYDARLVDIDLSRWHEQIALYVIGDHATEQTEKGAGPLFIVEFAHPSHWEWDTPNQQSTPREAPPTWRIENFRLDPLDQYWRCTLLGHEMTQSPTLIIVCADIDIRQVPLHQFTHSFAERSDPQSGFIRPGLDALIREDRT